MTAISSSGRPASRRSPAVECRRSCSPRFPRPSGCLHLDGASAFRRPGERSPRGSRIRARPRAMRSKPWRACRSRWARSSTASGSGSGTTPSLAAVLTPTSERASRPSCFDTTISPARSRGRPRQPKRLARSAALRRRRLPRRGGTRHRVHRAAGRGLPRPRYTGSVCRCSRREVAVEREDGVDVDVSTWTAKRKSAEVAATVPRIVLPESPASRMPVDELPQVLDLHVPHPGRVAESGQDVRCRCAARRGRASRRRALPRDGAYCPEPDSSRNRSASAESLMRAVADACLSRDDAEAVRLLNRVGRSRGVEGLAGCLAVALRLELVPRSSLSVVADIDVGDLAAVVDEGRREAAP